MTLPRRDARGRFIPSLNGPKRKRRKSSTQTGRVSCNQPNITIPTEILFILDKSASMTSCKQAAINGVNEFIRTQKQLDPYAVFTITLFNDYNTVKAPPCPMHSVPELNDRTYYPQGNTPLLDAIGDTVQGVYETFGKRYLCVIFTDGEENASRRWTVHTVKDLITRKEAQGNWTFVYLGANHDAYLASHRIGIDRGNTMSYVGTPIGTQHAMMAATIGSDSYVKSAARQTKSFFTTDLSGLDQRAVSNNLNNQYGMVDILPVTKEVEIQPFVEATGRVYNPGNAYYQLTKPETVQAYKQIMIMRKGTKTVYGGRDARDLLRIPSGNVRLTPGNHGDWDVFVQSHSTNRKLVRGTKLIYKK